MPTINISASWYNDCGPGARGACGTCDNTKMQCAWANLDGFPPENSIVATCGSSYCCEGVCATNLPSLSCGDVPLVKDFCTGKSAYITVADHGPYVCRCESSCSSGRYLRAIDLTEAAFDYLHGDLTDGYTAVNMRY